MSQPMNSKLVAPAEIQWEIGPAILPAGAQAAVLYGNPTKDGLFSMRFKLPKGYRVPPHTLSQAGLFTVISGTFRLGMGEKAHASNAAAMPAGSFIALAPGTALRLRGRGDGGSAQQYRPLGDHLHRSKGRPSSRASVIAGHNRRGGDISAPKKDPDK